MWYVDGIDLTWLFVILFLASVGLLFFMIHFFNTFFQNVKRVKHIERILVKQFGKDDNDFTFL